MEAPIITIAGGAAALKVLEFLIQNGANLNGQTPPGETTLMLAAFFNDDDNQTQPVYTRHETATKMLVEAGADAKVVNSQGKRALELAKAYNKTNMVPYLKCAENLAPGESFTNKCE